MRKKLQPHSDYGHAITEKNMFQVIFHKLTENVLQDTEYVCKLRSYISDIIDSNSEHAMQVCFLLQLLDKIHQGFL